MLLPATLHMCYCLVLCVCYLLSGLDWRQRDSLGVDDRQDLIADHRGDDLALSVGQELRGNWRHLQRRVAAPRLAGGSCRVWHQWDCSDYLGEKKEGDKTLDFVWRRIKRQDRRHMVVTSALSTLFTVCEWTDRCVCTL